MPVMSGSPSVSTMRLLHARLQRSRICPLDGLLSGKHRPRSRIAERNCPADNYGFCERMVQVASAGHQDAHVMKYLDVTKTAYLEAGATHGAYRRKGVATALVREAERLAKEHGCTHIGLEVGNADNPDAKRLYEHLGYVDWGQGNFSLAGNTLRGMAIPEQTRRLSRTCTNLSEQRCCIFLMSN